MSVHRRLRRGGRAGFTLMEILVVITLLSITSLAIITSFIQTVKIFDRFNGVLDAEEKMIFAQRLTRDVKNGTVYLSEPWRISDAALTFPSIPAGSGQGEGLGGLPSRISYQFLEEKKVVTRTESRFPYRKETEEIRIIATGVRSLKFEVLRDGEETIPQRLTVSLEYGSQNPAKTLKKIILIPAGYRDRSLP